MIDTTMIEKPLDLNDEELENLSKQDLVIRCKQMQLCVNSLEKLNSDYLNKLNKKSYENKSFPKRLDAKLVSVRPLAQQVHPSAY